MAIDKLVPRYLNLDDDERLVKSMEMTDAKNIHVSSEDENNEAGVIKQSFGNTEVLPKTVADTIPSGVNQIIGSVTFDADGVVFYFLWNSLAQHGIYMYDSEDGTYVKLYQNDALGFSKEAHIQAEVVKAGGGDTLLYFTDGETEPKKVNVSRLLSGSYESAVDDLTNETALSYITLCKRPPMKPPTFTFVNSGDANSNNRVIDRAFQFACQYVYTDGEVSAIGPYSKLTYSTDHFNTDGTMADLYNTPFDSIEVYNSKNQAGVGENVDGDVKAVRFLARAGNFGNWVVFDEVETSYQQNTNSATFTNTKAYRFVADQEVNKMYDAVPLKAKALCVTDNRLFLGNYVDGFNTDEWVEGPAADTASQSFPVTVNVQNAAFDEIEDLSSAAEMLTDLVESHIATRQAQALETANENLIHFHPNFTFTGIASGSDTEDSGGYFQRTPAFPYDWHTETNGDSAYQPTQGEKSARLGLSTNFPLELNIDLSSIPPEGFNIAAQLTVEYVVKCGKAYVIPTDPSRDSNQKQTTTFRYRPTYDAGAGGNAVRDLDISFFSGGEFFGDNMPSYFTNGGVDEDYGKVCGVGLIATPTTTTRSVTVSVQNSDTRLSIAQKLADAIESPANYQTTRVVKQGNGELTAHGVNYQFTSAIVDPRSGSEACRYICQRGANAPSSTIKFIPYQSFVVDAGASIKIIYKGEEAEFNVSTVGMHGPLQNAVDSAFVSAPIGPFNGLNNMQNIVIGSQPTPYTVSCVGMDGGSSNNGDDLYRTLVLDWMTEKTAASISLGNAGVVGGDEGDNRMTFRSGAHHPLGAVFYDHRNRNSAVKLLPESYVPFSGDATSLVGNEVNRLVPYDIDVTFPPSYIPDWAERYQIVYSGNSQFEFSLTHSIPEALVADLTRVVIRDPSLTDSQDLEETLDSDDNTNGTDAQAEANFPSLAAAESAGILSDALYLPMRFFEGKTDSYKSSFGMKLNYEFRPGDKLRILSYTVVKESAQEDGAPEVQTIHPDSYFFDIIDYKYFEPNSDKNVLSLPHAADGNFTKEGEYRRSGWMLIIKSNDLYDGFTTADVLGDGESDNFTKNCVVEILRPKIQPEDDEIVYYEIGESYHVDDDDREDVYNKPANQGPLAFVGTGVIQSYTRLFRGDQIRAESFPGNNSSMTGPEYFGQPGYGAAGGIIVTPSVSHTVERVIGKFDDGDGGIYYRYKVVNDAGEATVGFSVGAATLNDGTSVPQVPVALRAANCVFIESEYRAVHLTDQGDAYFRRRSMRTSAFNAVDLSWDPTDLTNYTSANFRLTNIEDPGFNDFLPSTVTRNYHFGRPHIYNPDFKVNVRGSSVTYSDVYASDGEVLNLSSFNPSQFPFKDYSLRYGSISRMFDEGAGIAVLQERKVSRTPVSRDYIQTAEGGTLITSSKVMGTETYLPGDYGPGHFSRGAVSYDGVIYFADVEKGLMCAVGGNQIVIISDKKVSSYFAKNLESVQSGSANRGAIAAIHPDRNELLISFNSRGRRTVSAGGTAYGRGLPVDPDTDTSFSLSEMRPVYSIKGSPLDMAVESQDWDKHLLNWESAGSGVVFVDHPTEIGFVEAGLSNKSTQDFIVTNQRNDFYGKMVRQAGSDYRGVLDESAGAGSKGGSSTTVSKSAVVAGVKDLIAYNFKLGAWVTKYEFEPDDMASTYEDMLSFRIGKPYLHDPNAAINNFYGIQKNSIIEVVSKKNPSMVKVYKALSLEGNSVWAADISNSEQTTSITTDMWKDQDIDGNVRAGEGFREGMLYCSMPGDTSDTSHLDEIVIGEVAATEGTAVKYLKFTSDISHVPYNQGDKIFLADGTDTGETFGVVDSDDRRRIVVTGFGGVTSGDIVVARPSVDTGHITGDRIRDYYIKIKLTNTSTERDELYAVNAIFDRSRLHNDQVN